MAMVKASSRGRLMLLTLTFVAVGFQVVLGETNPGDASALLSLRNQWQNLPPNWRRSDDPCGTPWDGIGCDNNSRVISLKLSTTGIKGNLTEDIVELTELLALDLSYNPELGGTLSPNIDRLKRLDALVLAGCNITGTIPAELGSLTNLTYINLSRNRLTGSIPASLGKLSKIDWLDFADNQLSGPLPVSSRTAPGLDILFTARHFHFNKNQFSGGIPPEIFNSKMILRHILFNENNFVGEIPETIGLVKTLVVLRLDRNQLTGSVPSTITNLPRLNELNLARNLLTGEVPDLNVINNLTYFIYANPFCFNQLNALYCVPRPENGTSYSTSVDNCISRSCPRGQRINPSTCTCAYPYMGLMRFSAPRFSNFINTSRFVRLENSIRTNLSLVSGSVYLENATFSEDNYLVLLLLLFPPDGTYFNRTEILRLGFELSRRVYRAPEQFDPYNYYAYLYPYQDVTGKRTSLSTGAVAGIVVACSVLLLALVIVGVYALKQKKRARRAIQMSNPFASWASSGTDAGSAPQLKEAKFFPVEDIKKFTSKFSKSNEIGEGGYGNVYKGMLPSGQVVAIKRSRQGSTQGAVEFKNEIELLSRVHHRNLVDLVGFCFDQGEQMLVYQFIPNGTLRENLAGITGIKLNWRRRLQIALDSATGLAYLHNHANPPIIHRDIKSSNILLDENLTAKVADFGISKLVLDNEEQVSTHIKGTLGYLDPEYYMTQRLTNKSDIYSFGVVMLEMITSKTPIYKGKYVVQEIIMALDRSDEEYYGIGDMIDPFIKNSPLTGFTRFVELAMRCVEESGDDRPSISEIVKEMEIIMQDDKSNLPQTFSPDAGFEKVKGVHHHPYIDQMPSEYLSNDAFDRSAEYALLFNIEPK